MTTEYNAVQESIKIALDAADAATDVTSEYNKTKREHKKLEASVKKRSSFLHHHLFMLDGDGSRGAVVCWHDLFPDHVGARHHDHDQPRGTCCLR